MSAQTAYLEAEVLSASPPKLRLLLIEGALRLARQSLRDWQTPLPVSVFESLAHLRKIIRELRNSLEPEDVSYGREMQRVFMFLLRAVTEAQLRLDAGKINEVVRILEVERETWCLLTQRFLEQTAVSQGPQREPALARPSSPLPCPAASPAAHAHSTWTDISGSGRRFSQEA